MHTWQDITEPGTIDDLIADAHAAGYPETNERLIHSWIAKGLLDQPLLRTLRRGWQKAEHSVNQRRLLLLLLDKRSQVAHLSALAQVPLACGCGGTATCPRGRRSGRGGRGSGVAGAARRWRARVPSAC